MKKYVGVIAILCLIKLSIHFAANSNYGFHRDELLHLSVAEHLAWGYMEFPPFIAFVGKVSTLVFDSTVFGTRVFPTLTGAMILILTCAMAFEMGGRKIAVLLAGICVLSFLPFYRNHTLFQPVVFDQLFWTLGLYFLIRYFNSKDKKFLFLMGVAAGLGLLNKYTFILWGAGIVVALLFYEKGSLYKNKWLYAASLLALLLILPNIVWQFNHNLPILLHHQKLQEVQLEKLGRFEFATDQLKFPFTLAISIFGLYALFADPRQMKYKSIGVFCVVVFVLMWVLKSKAYYFFSVYPVMFAAGAVKMETLSEAKRWVPYTLIVILAITTIPFIPELTPILPIEKYTSWTNKVPDAEGRYTLTNDYADMFGWEEQVQLIDSVYKTLSSEDQAQCIIWAENYGEAGAVKIIGKRTHGLPDPICTHGSFWLFGPGNLPGAVCISIGNEKSSVQQVFADCELIKVIRHKYAIDEEHNIPLYLCRNPMISLQEVWPSLEKSVFD